VVSIAGPCRKGKSYMLSKAFDQGDVFPLGHELDPETMGIWMWIVPDKFKVMFNSLMSLRLNPSRFRFLRGHQNKFACDPQVTSMLDLTNVCEVKGTLSSIFRIKTLKSQKHICINGRQKIIVQFC